MLRNAINFVDFINDSVRILILLDTANSLKPNLHMTENRIKLYDYYLKFPRTMMCDDVDIEEAKENFDEYYAFFHRQPDIARYRISLNFLISKGLIQKDIKNNDICFQILPNGSEALEKIKSNQKETLFCYANTIIPIISKLTDKNIEEEISKRTNLLFRKK
jgi:hypothetical protein